MARLVSVNDECWPEVQTINSYAIFMGYLLMGVRGLGLLVLTWTTVVLLGGFVSMLQKKDFWCLTVITLVQTAGVFDFLLKEKTSDIGNYLRGMMNAEVATVFSPFKKDKRKSDSKAKEEKGPSIAIIMLAVVLLAVQLLVLAPVLCLVAVLYVLGLYISAGISLWRLIEHDYRNAEGGANLKPALNVLYSLALAQGVVFSYKTVYDLVAKAGLVEQVANRYSLDTDLVKDYLDETVKVCMKDPTFARGRNLITYAVELLMESKSRYDYISGVLILGTILQPRSYGKVGQPALMELLLTGSAFFSHVVQRLMETFGPTSPYSTEIREHAARIVANVAPRIRLEKFPEEMIQCISSLLDTFEEFGWRPDGYNPPSYLAKDYERGWLLDIKEIEYYPSFQRLSQDSDRCNPLQGYKGLVVQGLRILQELAVHERNCRVIISNTTDQGQLSKTMVPLFSEQLHGDHHDEWSEIAEESMELLSRLMAAPGDTGSKLRSEISGKAAIVANNILECSKCGVFLKRKAIEILLDLSVDTLPSITSSGSNSTLFMWSLLHIFLLPDYCFIPLHFLEETRYDHYYRKMRGSTHLAKKSSYIRKLAGEKLQHAVLTLQDESNATSMLLQSPVAAVVADLARTSVDSAKNVTYRLHAVQILEDLCRWYTKDDECLKGLKNAMADVTPKVLKEFFCFWSTSAGIHSKAEAKKDQVSAQHTDIEKGVVPQGIGQEDASSHPQKKEDASSSQQQSADDMQHKGIKLQEAFISLCRAIPYKWTHEFDDLAEKMCLEQGIPKKDFFSLVWDARSLLEKQKKAQGLATEGYSSSNET